MWEYQFNRNCENMMDRSLGDYVLPEKKGQIPLMLTYPVLTNDARFLFIASQPMRFMMMPYDNKKNNITKKQQHEILHYLAGTPQYKTIHHEGMDLTILRFE